MNKCTDEKCSKHDKNFINIQEAISPHLPFISGEFKQLFLNFIKKIDIKDDVSISYIAGKVMAYILVDISHDIIPKNYKGYMEQVYKLAMSHEVVEDPNQKNH